MILFGGKNQVKLSFGVLPHVFPVGTCLLLCRVSPLLLKSFYAIDYNETGLWGLHFVYRGVGIEQK